MVEKLLDLLQRARKNLSLTVAQHAIAKRQVEAKRKKAHKLERRAREFAAKADVARREKRKRNAARLGAKADKVLALAELAHSGRRKAVERAKVLARKREGIDVHITDLEKAIAEAEKNHGVKVNAAHNRLSGGTFEQRITVAGDVACAQCAKGDRQNYYSQPGAWKIDVPFTGPRMGRDRSDCSAEVISWFYVAKGPSPSGTYSSGWTGSMEAHGHQITRAQAMRCPFAYALFGPPGQTHHTEKCRGNGTTQTQGHGSGRVDIGSFDMLGGTVRFFVPRELARKV